MGAQSANLWVLLGLGLASILVMTKKLKRAVKADFGAFVQRLQLLPPPQPAPPKAPHPLTGLTFAVSDLFDIDGFITGFGNPDWERTHDAASHTSQAISALVEGGAKCEGKTVVGDMAFGMSGDNSHFGMPTNPAAPNRVPGGPSSGSSVAVAANIVDFSLGIDSSGGVLLPAGYCGILGFRPSYGTVPHAGLIPVSSSLDTIGWFSKDPNILRRVGHVLLQVPFAIQRNPRNVIIADDWFKMISTPTDRITEVVTKSFEKTYGRQVLRRESIDKYLESKVPSLNAFPKKKSNGEASSAIKLLVNIMESLRRHEFKKNHGEWIQDAKPAVDPAILAKVHEGVELENTEMEICHMVRRELRTAINNLLKDDGVLVIPTVSDAPPKVGAKELVTEEYHMQASTFFSLASMSGCCQVTVPLGFHDKCPVSVSLMARHGGDRFLLDTMQTLYGSLQEQADIASKSKPSSKAVSQETSAEMAKEKGNQAFKEKQWQRAIGFYTEAIKLNSNIATYYSNRAAAYLELGSFLQAEADCTKAIDLDKKNVKSYLRRGTAREMIGFYKEAIEDFKHALVLEPTNKRASQSADRLRKLFQ